MEQRTGRFHLLWTKKLSGLTVLIVGASNAKRPAEAMESLVAKVDHTITTNWRPLKERVEVLAGTVTRGVDLVKPDMVLFQLLDNVL